MSECFSYDELTCTVLVWQDNLGSNMIAVKTCLGNPGAEDYVIKGKLVGANRMQLGGIWLYLRGWASGIRPTCRILYYNCQISLI